MSYKKQVRSVSMPSTEELKTAGIRELTAEELLTVNGGRQVKDDPYKDRISEVYPSSGSSGGSSENSGTGGSTDSSSGSSGTGGSTDSSSGNSSDNSAESSSGSSSDYSAGEYTDYWASSYADYWKNAYSGEYENSNSGSSDANSSSTGDSTDSSSGNSSDNYAESSSDSSDSWGSSSESPSDSGYSDDSSSSSTESSYSSNSGSSSPSYDDEESGSYSYSSSNETSNNNSSNSDSYSDKDDDSSYAENHSGSSSDNSLACGNNGKKQTSSNSDPIGPANKPNNEQTETSQQKPKIENNKSNVHPIFPKDIFNRPRKDLGPLKGIAPEYRPLWPTESKRITSEFGPLHDRGIDVGALEQGKKGDLVKASMGGTVTVARVPNWSGSKSTYVIVHGDDGNEYRYAHLDIYQGILEGHRVNQGELIGYMSDNGSPGQVHLHFEVRKAGKPLDPTVILP